MRILVSGHGRDRVALNAARRAVGYDKLVLLSHTPEADDLTELRENETLAGATVEIHPAPDDLLGALAIAHEVLTRPPTDSVVVHVAGSTNLVTSALLLACFERGVTAFFCHERGISRLPVIREAAFVDRFTDADVAVLLRIPASGRITHQALADDRLALPTVKMSLGRLKKLRVADPDGTTVALTASGAYYQRQLQTKGGAKLRGKIEQSESAAKGGPRVRKPHARRRGDAPPSPSRKGRRLRSG